MTTKKQLKEKSERLECQLTAQVDALHRSIIKCERVKRDLADADKTIDYQRAAIRTQNESMSCSGCQYANREKPQKCDCCRRGAKDNYTEATP
jgi:hypothetical protein